MTSCERFEEQSTKILLSVAQECKLLWKTRGLIRVLLYILKLSIYFSLSLSRE
jgi:hypothetical protein